MTSHERADAIIERIRKIYDSYEDTLIKQLEEDDADEDALAHEIALANYNWEKIMLMYESDPAEFLEAYGGINTMEDIDILVDWILFEE